MDKEPDPLWIEAQERVRARMHLYRFVVINALLWLIWLGDNLWNKYSSSRPIPWTKPWPMYITFLWAVFLILSRLESGRAIEKEYDKLKKEKKDE